MMQLRLSVPCPNTPDLPVEVRNVTVEERVDRTRAISQDDVVMTITRAFGAQNVVPDVDRYRLSLSNNRIALHSHSVCEVSTCSNRYYDVLPEEPNARYSKTIVVILESPHKDEYLRDVSQPIAPAQGATGSNLQGWLDCVLQGCPALCAELEEETTRVVIANPVQYQASLASVIRSSAWRKVRDAVWRALWSCQSIKDDFEARLARYSPDFIINACTHDVNCKCSSRRHGDAECKKYKVRSFLRRPDHLQAASVYETNHPSSWNMRCRRGITALE